MTAELAPQLELTTTFTSDTEFAGAVVVIEVALTTTNEAGRPPNVTALAPVNPEPVIVTAVVPSAAPRLTDRALIVGAVQEPSVYVKALLNAVVPLALVTDIEPTPADPGGVTKVKDESLTTAKLVAAVPPTLTPVVPVKLPPDTVMVVPPVVDPLTGEMESSRGATVNDRAYRSKLGDPDPGLPTVFAVATFFNAVSTCAGVAVLLRLR